MSRFIKYCYSKDDFTAFSDRLLAPGGSREDAFKIAKGCLFLVEAKRQGSRTDLGLLCSGTVGQAIALLKSAKYVSLVCFTSSFDKFAFQHSRGPFLSI